MIPDDWRPVENFFSPREVITIVVVAVIVGIALGYFARAWL